MTDDEIDKKANEILIAWELEETLPVDPVDIAGKEGIDVLPGHYGGCFDGRIEYRTESGVGQFYLLHAEEALPYRPSGRVRFSIAHELGHFYLSEHRKYLLSGQFHNSHSDFVSSRVWEKEADRFAARLLMPTELFRDNVYSRKGFLTLGDLSRLASNTFHTSLTSLVLRYVDMNFEACCVVVAEKGIVKWASRSDDMKRQGLGWVQFGTKLPTNSVSAKAIMSTLCDTNLKTEGEVDSSVWFDRHNSRRLWEEVALLSNLGRTLTFMAPVHD